MRAAGKEMLSDIIGNVRKFAAGVSELDDAVGAAVAQVRKRGLVDNTLIVFTSTCGSLLGRHGLWDSGDASDPVNMYDEVIATPMLWSWAGRVPAIAMQVELIASYDFAPTICEALGVAAFKRMARQQLSADGYRQAVSQEDPLARDSLRLVQEHRYGARGALQVDPPQRWQRPERTLRSDGGSTRADEPGG